MNFETLFFFFFSGIALTSAIFVIYSTNTIYSAFFLILVFTSTTGLLLISEVEFISIMLIIIYVGAITVLFLFVIMMLDINISNNLKSNYGYLPIIILISLIFLSETFIMFSKIFTTYFHNIQNYLISLDKLPNYSQFIYQLDNITNIETLGQVLYTYYTIFFLIAGLILLIALIGAVMLTFTSKKKLLSKNLYQQLSRNSSYAIFNIKFKKYKIK